MDMMQKEFHAYDGATYVGLVVATDAQLAAMGYTAGVEPPTPAPSTDPRDYPLSPRQFNRFAALHGYDDAIAAVLAALKATDRETYATIKGDVMGAGQFRFENVLAIIGNPAVALAIPQGVDVSEATLSTRWMEAKDF